MSRFSGIIPAIKCIPKYKIFSEIKKAGLEAVDLYLSEIIMNDLKKIIRL